jgi:hypothetical protein
MEAAGSLKTSQKFANKGIHILASYYGFHFHFNIIHHLAKLSRSYPPSPQHNIPNITFLLRRTQSRLKRLAKFQAGCEGNQLTSIHPLPK